MIAPSNLTNAELVRHIEHEFPDLDGSLKMLLERFEGLIELPEADGENG